jgi:hypothetical protein
MKCWQKYLLRTGEIIIYTLEIILKILAAL